MNYTSSVRVRYMPPFSSLTIVALGGALGAVSRYAMSGAIAHRYGADFPWPTLAVNLLGALIIGFIAEYFAFHGEAHENLRLFLVTGILGGFTTFSAFSMETSLLIQRGDLLAALAYVGVSVIGTVALVIAGKHLAQIF